MRQLQGAVETNRGKIMANNGRIHLFLATALLALGGCGDTPENNQGATSAQGSSPPATGESHDAGSLYQAALADSGRTEQDRQRDSKRKPAATLEFFAIKPGMVVFDLFSGGGYYTELLSHIVGPTGRVVAHNNAAYAAFIGDEATVRYADGRLANVEHLAAENNELELPAATFDAAMMILAYHDIYYISPENGWDEIDGPLLLAQIYAGLKSGGILAVVDHYAATGSPRETGATLHRIDPLIVIDEIEAAGFVLEGQSDVLRNKDDDHNLNMSAPEIRGKTDRFVLRFRKP